ncbi:Uncharacterized protein YibN [Serratia symbiotica]|nr:Uncharacterized protein YibN [Serratia symbiotica]
MQSIIPFISNHPILSLTWIVLLVALIVITIQNHFSTVQEVSRGEATRLINKENALVVDTRRSDHFRKAHLPNSINLTPSEIKSGNLGDLTKHTAHPIIVACANGTASRESAEHLNKSGFDNVVILKEGITGWNTENLPLVRRK